jgi:hypothetical protein
MLDFNILILTQSLKFLEIVFIFRKKKIKNEKTLDKTYVKEIIWFSLGLEPKFSYLKFKYSI